MNKYIEETVLKHLNESGYSRVANIMRGLVESVNTIGFITAENPLGKPATPQYNKNANNELEKLLRSKGYGYNKILGKYGVEENTFFVQNIDKKTLLELGSKFDQDTVIFGEKTKNNEYVGMRFYMIGSTKDKNFGNIEGVQDVFVNLENPQDFYSKVKGRKFVIPFYGIEDKVDISKNYERIRNRDYENVKWDKGSATPKTDISYKRKQGTSIGEPEKISV